MSAITRSYDIVIIGSGPAGHHAAITGCKAGKNVLVVERDLGLGGACVHQGTIPSKTLRETALSLSKFKRQSGDIFEVRAPEDLQVASLMTRLEQVAKAHVRNIKKQFDNLGCDILHGRARFVSAHEIEIESVDGTKTCVQGNHIVIATGSRPRDPDDVPVDHEHILDSDSILSMYYLPPSLTILGSGVIASEYASIFACLGVKVTMIDKHERPLGFLEPELTESFVTILRKNGGVFLGGRNIRHVEWDGVSEVVAVLDHDEAVRSAKMLFALGRVANVERLNIEAAGLSINRRGHIPVDANCRTEVAHIYAAGDVVGPPALASTSMEQGRRAVRHALGLQSDVTSDRIPMGIYTIPEISSIGLTEAQARDQYGDVLVSISRFEQLSRGQISAMETGLLKLVADPKGRKLLGVHIVGEGATELIHMGQLALLSGNEIDVFVDNIFNFPTLAQSYRLAALEIIYQRP